MTVRPFALVVLALAAGCAHAPPPPAAAPAAVEPLRARDFYPLRVGSQWTYELVAGPKVERRSVRILSEEQGYFVDDQKGALRLDARGLRDRDRYLLEEPIEAGHRWTSVLSVTATERYEILEAGRPCSAPAGTFARCVVVRGTLRQDARIQLVNEWTYAEGVGLVGLKSGVAEDAKATRPLFELRLVSYQTAP